MDQLELSTQKIAEFFKTKKLPVNDTTLIKDKNFNITVGIIHPKQEDKLSLEKSSLGKKKIPTHENFTFLPNLPIIHEINIIEVTLKDKNTFWIREFQFSDLNAIYVSHEEIVDLNQILLFLRKNQKLYTTLVLNQELIYSNLPIEHDIDFTTSTGYKIFPPLTQAMPLKNMALIYDYNSFDLAYTEAQEIEKTLKKFFPKISIDLYGTPLTKKKFDSILAEYSIVHFSGHVDKKGLQIGAKEFYHPNYSTNKLPDLLFINGCTLSKELLKPLILRQPEYLFYFEEDILDILIQPKDIANFYLGLFLGYKVKDLISIFSNKNMRFYGWAHKNFHIQ